MTKENDFVNCVQRSGDLGETIVYDPGLTKLEYFAAMAMHGMLANNDGVNRIWAKAKELNEDPIIAGIAAEKCIAECSVAMAKTLISELSKLPHNKSVNSLLIRELQTVRLGMLLTIKTCL